MYYDDQICCEIWIISSMKSRLDYAEIPYGSSIFRVCRLRGSYGGPGDNDDFSHLFLEVDNRYVKSVQRWEIFVLGGRSRIFTGVKTLPPRILGDLFHVFRFAKSREIGGQRWNNRDA